MIQKRLKELCDLSPFVTGPAATTEIHAGGVFFCVLYRRELVFYPDGRVDLVVRVLDNWRPLDGEGKSPTSPIKGKLTPNARDYIEISFPSMTFTGLECENLPGHIAFDVFAELKHDPAIDAIMGDNPSRLPSHYNESVVFYSGNH